MDFKFCLELVQVDKAVHGLLYVGGFEKSGSVSGVNDYPRVILSGHFFKHGALFVGEFTGPDTIQGEMRVREHLVDVTFERTRDGRCRE